MDRFEKPRVLIIDDKQANLTALSALLESLDVAIFEATSGNEGLAMTLEHEFALVLLDVQMPEMDGFETAELMRGSLHAKHVPIIFVTAISKEQGHIFKGYESGAVDYIFKPLDPEILKSKVKVFLNLFLQKQVIEDKKRKLEEANRQILDQQKALVQEERLKVLLQIAGATAHELNQPLMILLGNIEIIELVKDDHQKVLELIPKIQKAGETISNIVKKIQNVRYDTTVKHDGTTEIIKLDQEIRVLSVEDSDSVFQLLTAYFIENKNIRLFRAKTIKEARCRLEEMPFDIILLDYVFSDGTGFDLLAAMKSENIDLPVIALSGTGDAQVASDFIKAGALDYLSKAHINKDSLFKAIHVTLEKFALKKEIDQSIKAMSNFSTRDELTGLYNRRYMESVLDQETERARRYNTDLCCLMLDLDFFKKVNDTYGHLCGDFVLREFSNQLKKEKRQSDYIFRYGGEEFVCLIPQTDVQGALQLAEKIRTRCQGEEFIFEGHRLNLTVSIGVSSFDKHTNGKIALIDYADKALYKAKANGRNCVKVYHQS